MLLASLVLYAFIALSLGIAPLDSLPSSKAFSSKTHLLKAPDNTPPQSIFIPIPSYKATAHLFTDNEFRYLREALEMIDFPSDGGTKTFDELKKSIWKLHLTIKSKEPKRTRGLNILYEYANVVSWFRAFRATHPNTQEMEGYRWMLRELRKNPKFRNLFKNYGPEMVDSANVSIDALLGVINQRVSKFETMGFIVIRPECRFEHLTKTWRVINAFYETYGTSEKWQTMIKKFIRTVKDLIWIFNEKYGESEEGKAMVEKFLHIVKELKTLRVKVVDIEGV